MFYSHCESNNIYGTISCKRKGIFVLHLKSFGLNIAAMHASCFLPLNLLC